MRSHTKHFHRFVIGCSMMIGPAVAHAQNLVPNGGFEEVLLCPDFQSQLDRTAFWFDPSEGGTPDFYHACATNDWYATPTSTVGFQETVDGQAYAGIFLWIQNVLDNWREYLEVGLNAPLVPGQCYHFRLHANLADFSGFTTDDLGVFFSVDSVLSEDPYPPGMTAQLSLASGTFLDREAWTVLEGDYIASGGERFLMIGNFLWDAGITVQEAPDGPPNTGDFVYCLVDSVSLTPCGAIVLGNGEHPAPLVSGPMPFTDELLLRPFPGAGSVFVYDASGRTMMRSDGREEAVNTSAWPPGMYILEMRSVMGPVARQRLVKR